MNALHRHAVIAPVSRPANLSCPNGDVAVVESARLFVRPMERDDTQYDTTSILATIERRFGVSPLSTRDGAVNDLSNVYDTYDDPNLDNPRPRAGHRV